VPSSLLEVHSFFMDLWYILSILVFEGILELHPGAINSIPSKSHVEIGMLLTVN